MNGTRQKLRLRFDSKVLLPMVGIIVVLLTGTMWIVNNHLTRQIQDGAIRALGTSDAVFQNSQKIRARNLQLRFGNVPNEPRFRAACQPAKPKTMQTLLGELLNEYGSDVIAYTTNKGQLFAMVSRDPSLVAGQFSSNTATSVERALLGQSTVDTIGVGAKIFDVVSIPVDNGTGIIGALTVAGELNQAAVEELRQLIRNEICLFADYQVVVSTLPKSDLWSQCVNLFLQLDSHNPAEGSGSSNPVEEATLNGDKYLCLSGRLSTGNNHNRLGYLLLSSEEPALVALRETQRTLLIVALLGVLVSSIIVWLVLRHITRPLRQLRELADAVGRGDFSRRVEAGGGEECIELAEAFNKMTENLELSRQKLEETVETLQATKAQLTQHDKLSMIGEFVSGVAHELNNPLASVYGFAQLLQRAEIDEKQMHYIDRIVGESQRCHKIVQNLLSFARPGKPERRLVDVPDLMQSSLEILDYQLRTSNINVAIGHQSRMPCVMADPHQLQQVFINIINNARQAIEGHRPDGRLQITMQATDGKVRVEFRDNGPGISEENLQKMFTPFFTTKEVGKGTGLGLSLCYGIIQEHGGTITVRSKVGHHAVFIIELPATAEDKAREKAVTPVVAVPADESKGRDKRILVVDDEEPLRDLISEVLKADSFAVDTAGDGAAALQKTKGARYDLIICDWKMPGVDGLEFYKRLRAADPQAAERFLFLTGDVVGAQKQLGDHVDHWLNKPFTITDLRNAIEKAFSLN